MFGVQYVVRLARVFTDSMHKDTSTSLGLNFISLYRYISSMYVQAAKALTRLHGCESSSEPQLVD